MDDVVPLIFETEKINQLIPQSIQKTNFEQRYDPYTFNLSYNHLHVPSVHVNTLATYDSPLIDVYIV